MHPNILPLPTAPEPAIETAPLTEDSAKIIELVPRDVVIVRWFLNDGLTTSEIGRRLKISAVRVQQILRELGINAHEVYQRRRRHELRIRRLSRKRMIRKQRIQRLEAKYKPWRELWLNGLTIAEMASALKKPAATVYYCIQYLRHEYGYHWFPLRKTRKVYYLSKISSNALLPLNCKKDGIPETGPHEYLQL